MVHIEIRVAARLSVWRNLNKYRSNVRVAHEAHADGFYAVVDVHARRDWFHQVLGVQVSPGLVKHLERPGILAYQVLYKLVSENEKYELVVCTYQTMKLMSGFNLPTICWVLGVASNSLHIRAWFKRLVQRLQTSSVDRNSVN